MIIFCSLFSVWTIFLWSLPNFVTSQITPTHSHLRRKNNDNEYVSILSNENLLSRATDPKLSSNSFIKLESNNDDMTWYELTAPLTEYMSVTFSSSGQYLAASGDSGLFYSHDFGQSWQQSGISQSGGEFDAITSSCSGQYVYAAQSNGENVFISSNYGSNYTYSPNLSTFTHITTSCSGQYVYGTASTGVYQSTNYGVDWAQLTAFTVSESDGYSGIACNSTGGFVAAVQTSSRSKGKVATSYNFGATVAFSSSPEESWYNIVSDSTGQYLAATTAASGVLTSTNYGIDWTDYTTTTDGYTELACDSTGQYLILVPSVSTASVLLSSDYGQTYTTSTAPTGQVWSSIASDATGQRVLGIFGSGALYLGVNNVTASPTYSPTSISAIPTGVPTVPPSTSINTATPTTATVTSAPTFAPTTPYLLYWSNLEAPETEYMGVASSDSGQYLVASTTSGGIFYSLNSGESWFGSDAPTTHAYTSVASSASGQYTYATADTAVGIYRSVNYGVNFTESAAFGFSTGSVTTCDSGEIVYVSTPLDIYKSSDFGASFALVSSINSNSSSTDYYQGIATNSTGELLLVGMLNIGAGVSYNSGTTWTYATFSTSVSNVASDSTGQYLAATSTSTYLYLSSDGGISWQANEAVTYPSFVYICMSNSGQNIVLAPSGANRPMLLSQNFGDSWTTSLSPTNSDVAWVAIACDSTSQRVIGAFGNDTLYIGVANNSPTVAPVVSPSIAASLTPSSVSSLPTVPPSAQPTLVPSTMLPSTTSEPTAAYQLYWSSANAPVVAFNGVGSSQSGQYLVASTMSSGIYYSTDFGGTWQSSNISVSDALSNVYNQVAISCSGQNVFVTSENSDSLFVSDDYGATFSTSLVEFDSMAYYVACSCSGQYVYVTATDVVYNSAIYGNNFDTLAVPIPSGTSFNGVATNSTGQFIAVVIEATGVTISHDYGVTWANSSIAKTVNNIVCDSTGQYLAVTSYSNYMYYSSDGGASWQPCIEAYGDRDYIVLYEYVTMSSSGQYLAAASNAAGYDILLSQDFGASWYASGSPLSATAIWNGIACDSSGERVIAAFSNSTLYIGTSNDSPTAAPVASPSIAPSVAPSFVSLMPTVSPSQQPTISIPTVSSAPSSAGTTPTTEPTTTYQVYWSAVPSLHAPFLGLSSSSSGQYLVATTSTDGIYYSADWGSTWQHSNASASNYYTAVASSCSGKYVYTLVDDSGVGAYRSSNYGVNFTASQTVFDVASYLATSCSGQYVYITTISTVYLSDNFGVTYAALSGLAPTSGGYGWTGIACNSTGQFVAVVDNAGPLYLSHDYGQSWSNQTLAFTQLDSVFSDSAGVNLVVTSYLQGVLVSNDGGVTWTVPPFVSDGGDIFYPFVCGSDSGQYLAVAPDDFDQPILLSQDYGASWQSSAAPVSSASYWDAMACDSTGQRLIAAYSNDTLYIGTSNNSPTQAPVVSPTIAPTASSATPPTAPTTAELNLLWYEASAPQQTYLAVTVSQSGVYMTASTEHGMYFSNNSGNNWFQGHPTTLYFVASACSASGQYVYAVQESSTYVYYSTNYGANWTVSATAVSDVLFLTASDSGQYVYVTTATDIYGSSDFGVTYSFLPDSETSNDDISWGGVACNSTGQFVVAVQQGGSVYTSTNYGVTFTEVPDTASTWYYVISDSAGVNLAASNSDGIYVSANTGASWTHTSAPTDSAFLYLCGDTTGQYLSIAAELVNNSVLLSSDFGVSWEVSQGSPRSVSGAYYSIACSGDGQTVVAAYSNQHVYIGSTSTFAPTIMPTSTSQPNTIAPSTAPTTAPTAAPTTAELNLLWYAVSAQLPSCEVATVSQDGVYMTVSSGVGMYYSNNSGNNWYRGQPDISFTDSASSGTGQYVYAFSLSSSNYIFYSSNFGANFTASQTSIANAQYIATSSETGQFVYVTSSFVIYVSSDFGVTYSFIQSTEIDAASGITWSGVACNSTGQFVVALQEGGSVHTSTNYGASFTEVYKVANDWYYVTSDMAGMHLLASSLSGVWVSANSGANWTLTSVPTSSEYNFVCSDREGQYLAVASQTANNSVLLSSDFGTTWEVSQGSPRSPTVEYRSLACTGDGQTLVTTLSTQQIYIGSTSTFAPTATPTSGGSSHPSSAITIAPSGVPSSAPTTSELNLLWYEASAPQQTYLAVTVSQSGVYMTASTEYGVYFSNNSGNNWFLGQPTTLYSTATVCSSSGQYVYALAQASSFVYYSSNYGATFTASQTSVFDSMFITTSSETGQYVYVTTATEIYKSSDFGETYTALPSSLVVSTEIVAWYGVACNATGQFVVVVQDGGTIFTSTDYGSTFTNVTSVASSWYNVISDSAGVHLAATAYDGIWTSSDSGVSWQLSSAPVDQGYWYLCGDITGQFLATATDITNTSVLLSSDFGSTWVVSAGSPIMADETYTSLACTGDGQTLLAAYSNQHVYIGSTSTFAPTALPTSSTPQPSVNSSIPSVAPTSSGSSQVTSIAPSASPSTAPTTAELNLLWYEAAAPLQSYLAVTVSQSGVYMTASTDHGMYFSNTSGNNWFQGHPTTLYFVASACSASGQYVYAVQESSTSVYYSTNYGANWTASATAVSDVLFLTASDSGQFVYVTTATEIYGSSDFGVTYSFLPDTDIDVTGNDGDLSWSGVACNSTGQFVVAVQRGGSVFTSTNYGVTFSVVAGTSGTWYNVISDSAGVNLAASNSEGIYVSADSGASWTLTSVPTDSSYLYLCGDTTGQYLALAADAVNNSVLLSSDFGSTWEVSQGSPRSVSGAYYSIACSGDGQTVVTAYSNQHVYIGSTSTFAPTIMPTSSTLQPSVNSSIPSVAPTIQPSSQLTTITPSATPTAPTQQPSVSPTAGIYHLNWYATNENMGFGFTYASISDDGLYMTASTADHGMYYSNNNGNVWVASDAPQLSFYRSAASSTGQFVYVLEASASGLYYSENYGVNWKASNDTFPSNAIDIATSDSGQYVYVTTADWIYLSSDYGQSFGSILGTQISNTSTTAWYGVTCNGTGNFMSAVVTGGNVWTTNDFGSTFSVTGQVAGWLGITSDSTGQYLAASITYSGVWTSADFGNTWAASGLSGTADDNPVYELYYFVCSDNTGQYLAAASTDSGQPVMLSSNYGATWNVSTGSPVDINYDYYTLVCDGSGQKLVAPYTNAIIYIGETLSEAPTTAPTSIPTVTSTTMEPTSTSSAVPSMSPTFNATLVPSLTPTTAPTSEPSHSAVPTSEPSHSAAPSTNTTAPSPSPTAQPSESSTISPSVEPSVVPTIAPSSESVSPSETPSIQPTIVPSNSVAPSETPTVEPTFTITTSPTSAVPSLFPTSAVPTVMYNLSWAASDAPSLDWYSLASCGNGQYLTAVAFEDGVYYSHNGGYHWVQSNASQQRWTSVAMSQSGQYQVAVAEQKGVFLSQNFGVNWTLSFNMDFEWTCVCTSGSGAYVYAGTSGATANLFSSSDYGYSFNVANLYINLQSIATSSNGKYVVAVGLGFIYTSNSYGATWVQSVVPNNQYLSVATDSTGQYCATTAGYAGLFTSTNWGVNWTVNPHTEDLNGIAIASSSSGAKLSAVVVGHPIFSSNNYGLTWEASDDTLAAWNTIAMDSTGELVAAGTVGSTIYIGSNVTYVGVPSFSPTMMPTGDDDASTNSVDFNVFSASADVNILFVFAPGMLLLLVRLLLISVRYKHPQSEQLNVLHSTYLELLDTVLKVVNVTLAFNNLVFSTSTPELGFLVASRLIVLAAWAVFTFALVMPNRADKVTQTASIYTFLNADVMQSQYVINFCCISISIPMRLVCLSVFVVSIFDMTALRLLPWARSEFTDKIIGYPTMFIVRCCLYSTFMAIAAQSVASIFDVFSISHNELSYLFMIVSLFSMVLSFFYVVLFVQIANASTLKVFISFRDSKDESGLPNKEDIESNRNTENPIIRHNSNSIFEMTPQLMRRNTNMDNGVRNSIQHNEVIATSIIEVPNNPVHTRVVQQATPEEVPQPEEEEEQREETKKEKLKKKNKYDIEEQEVEIDERGLIFNAKIKYADETINVLKDQLAKQGTSPLEYIPLKALKAELEDIFALANNGSPYDEARLDYLLQCMDFNPEYKRELEEEARLWRERMTDFAEESLETMKGFVSPQIFHSTLATLTDGDGYSVALAKRLLSKKCLWLVRITQSDIERMHIAELQGRFNPQAQGLDIVETAAIYAALPPVFSKDNKKEIWRKSVENALKQLDKERSTGKLVGMKLRNPAYKNQTPAFFERESMHQMGILEGNDAFKPRDSFRALTRPAVNSNQISNVISAKTIKATRDHSGDSSSQSLENRTEQQEKVTVPAPGKLETGEVGESINNILHKRMSQRSNNNNITNDSGISDHNPPTADK